MTKSKPGSLLRIFIGELDTHENRPLYEWLVEEARRQGMAGATVLRGLEGFGASRHVHTAKVLRLSVDLPVVVEVVDSAERIERFLDKIDEVVHEGLVTVERVQMRVYRRE